MAANQGAPAADTGAGDAYVTESSITGMPLVAQYAVTYVTETVTPAVVVAGASGILGLASCEY